MPTVCLRGKSLYIILDNVTWLCRGYLYLRNYLFVQVNYIIDEAQPLLILEFFEFFVGQTISNNYSRKFKREICIKMSYC